MEEQDRNNESALDSLIVAENSAPSRRMKQMLPPLLRVAFSVLGINVLIFLLGDWWGVWLETGQGIQNLFAENGLETRALSSWITLWGTILLSLTLSLALWEAPDHWRRGLLLLGGVVVLGMSSPVAALWGWFLNPLMWMIAVLITGMGVIWYLEKIIHYGKDRSSY